MGNKAGFNDSIEERRLTLPVSGLGWFVPGARPVMVCK